MVDVPLRTWIAAALAFVAVALGVVSLVLVVEWAAERRRRKQVGEQLRRLDLETGAAAGAAGSILRGEAGAVPAWAARLPQLRDLQHVMQQAGLTWTLQTFLLLTAGFAVALGLGALVALGLGLGPPFAAAAGGILPYLYVRRCRDKRLGRFEEQLPDAVDLMGRAIRAGHPLSAGLRMLATEMTDPIAGEFRQVAEEQRFGMPFEDTLVGLADRVPLVDVRILVTAILIQREVGGNLAEILDKIAYVIRERFTIRRQLRVITAEGRMSMWVLMGLPPGMAVILFFLNPAYIGTLFTDPIGHLMIYASLVMGFMGFLWIRRIVNIEI
jgi:tight adherence protein B